MKRLTFEQAMEDSYNHFVNDLGKIPDESQLYFDIIRNYVGFNHIDSCFENFSAAFDKIEEFLSRK